MRSGASQLINSSLSECLIVVNADIIQNGNVIFNVCHNYDFFAIFQVERCNFINFNKIPINKMYGLFNLFGNIHSFQPLHTGMNLQNINKLCGHNKESFDINSFTKIVQ